MNKERRLTDEPIFAGIAEPYPEGDVQPKDYLLSPGTGWESFPTKEKYNHQNPFFKTTQTAQINCQKEQKEQKEKKEGSEVFVSERKSTDDINEGCNPHFEPWYPMNEAVQTVKLERSDFERVKEYYRVAISTERGYHHSWHQIKDSVDWDTFCTRSLSHFRKWFEPADDEDEEEEEENDVKKEKGEKEEKEEKEEKDENGGKKEKDDIEWGDAVHKEMFCKESEKMATNSRRAFKKFLERGGFAQLYKVPGSQTHIFFQHYLGNCDMDYARVDAVHLTENGLCIYRLVATDSCFMDEMDSLCWRDKRKTDWPTAAWDRRIKAGKTGYVLDFGKGTFEPESLT